MPDDAREADELIEYKNQLSARIDSVDHTYRLDSVRHTFIQESTITKANTTYSKSCLYKCFKDYDRCYKTAVRFRDSDYYACTTLIVDRVESQDVYCTRQIIVGYGTRIVNGEEVEDRPIYREERYVCGQKNVNIYTDDPERRRAYYECRVQAMEYFLEEVERCDSRRMVCERKCGKPEFDDGPGVEY